MYVIKQDQNYKVVYNDTIVGTYKRIGGIALSTTGYKYAFRNEAFIRYPYQEPYQEDIFWGCNDNGKSVTLAKGVYCNLPVQKDERVYIDPLYKPFDPSRNNGYDSPEPTMDQVYPYNIHWENINFIWEEKNIHVIETHLMIREQKIADRLISLNLIFSDNIQSKVNSLIQNIADRYPEGPRRERLLSLIHKLVKQYEYTDLQYLIIHELIRQLQ